ncbi:MAG: ImpB/MucB/SamB family protein [Rhodospirillaceae bacterium]|nr:ImpB/MucB/SamB family protein [Rhodospirillaceae bacterium]|tara:strand:- start:883 stop:2157 length:1275 start_codon:yes stop_codon:yes gene_type:complete
MALALVDCENFYASCERIFRPDLKNTPIVVLSNNDGCVIARSTEAKEMGIDMGVPWFRVKNSFLNQGGKVFSSNFTFYGDMSARVMNILEGFVPKVETYSIDEAFLELDTLKKHYDLYDFGCHIRNLVRQWTGVPVRIGIAPTKTLTKIAVNEVKRLNIPTNVYRLTTKKDIRNALANTPIHNVWGVGKKLDIHLKKIKITNALHLADKDPSYIKQQFSVVLERTVRELRGERCLGIEDNITAKKQIIVSRSFGNRVRNLQTLKPIISNFSARAAEKLRNEKQNCSQVSVFIRTSNFNIYKPKHIGQKTIDLSTPTSDTRDILTAAKKALIFIFKPGYEYAKAGVLLSKFTDEKFKQYSLFKNFNKTKANTQLMQHIDQFNAYEIQIFYASQNISHWSPTKQNMTSPKYTTNWHELPIVNQEEK